MRMRLLLLLPAVVLWPVIVAANTCVAPKPLPTIAFCGQAHDPTGASVPSVELRLLDGQRAVVSEVHADANGNFAFPPLPKGEYVITASDGWYLSWPITVTNSKQMRRCKQPLYVKLGLMSCEGGVSRKEYHDKWQEALSVQVRKGTLETLSSRAESIVREAHDACSRGTCCLLA